eukprot:3692467-Prymnesium_polylepis.1
MPRRRRPSASARRFAISADRDTPPPTELAAGWLAAAGFILKTQEEMPLSRLNPQNMRARLT